MAKAPLTAIFQQVRSFAARRDQPGSSDGELLRVFLESGHEPAFEEIVRRHGPMVLGVCRRSLGSLPDAEDAFQATFLVLLRRASSVRKASSLAGWLHGVARRVAADARRASSRRKYHERQAPVGGPPNPASSAALREICRILEEEVSRLPSCFREPFVLCCLEGLSCAEVAARLSLNEPAVRNRLSRARKLLRLRLARRSVSLSAALAAAALVPGGAAGAVPQSLLVAAVKAAAHLATRGALTGGPEAAAVMALVERGSRAMSPALMKLVTVTALALATLVFAVAAQQGGKPADTPKDSFLPAAAPPTERQEVKPALDRHGDPLPPGAVARMGTVRFRTGTTVNTVAWAPNGQLLASAGEGRLIQIWDPMSGKEVARLPALGNSVKCLTFSPDGKWLAVTGEGAGIRLWDASRFGKQYRPRQLIGQESGASLAFAPDRKTLYSCGYDGFIRVWDLATGRELRRFGLPPAGKGGQWFTCIALDPDGSLLVSRNIALDADKLQTVATHLWNPVTGKHIRQLGKTERGHFGGESYSAVFSPDGRTVAAVNDDGLKLWNADTGAELAVLKVGSQRMAFAPDGRSLYGGHDGHLCQWAVPSGRLLRSFDGECSSHSPIALSPNGKTIATGEGNAAATPLNVAVWDVKTGKRRHSWPGHTTPLWSLFFINGGKELLTVGDGSFVHRWDLEGRRLGTWKQPGNWVLTTAALSPDAKTLAVQDNDLRALLVDPLTGKERQSFTKHLDRKWRLPRYYFPMQFAFSPDSRRVLSASGGIDRHVRLWEADTAREIWNVMTGKPDTLVQGFALSSDGQTLYLAGDGGPVKVYAVGKAPLAGQAQRQLGAAKTAIGSLCLSPDGRRLAGVGSDQIFLWDTATGAEVGRLPGPKVSELYNRRFMTFSPDGRMLAIWTGDEPTVRCVDIASGQVRLETTGHLESVLAVEFSADGRHLATGGTDTTALLWDVRALSLAGNVARNVDLERLCSELAAPDARVAYRAVVQLQQLGPRAVTLLADRLKPVNRRPLAACLADLDDDDFRVRERATEELLGRVGDRGELAKALAATRSVEVRSRLQRILGTLSKYDPRKDVRRLMSLRGLETLEGIGTPQARRLVERLARGAPEAELTREEAATLKRLRQRHMADP
jgi:RNA polymerase sigma factor (sigma-70 family)